ncbi:hypothetical protein Poli38472_008737 [Pythium oligandrum]|uniref:Uncharacterized protein n=1 Tax=Pythium oligandrum TaxID=41045 RepID=A0A8K1C443_PYTOL|nr:hypothetical protein Poli38472_008737 [Pythium oligandrum]|eukprot:TMW56089.1 hypothetical protein Poli38472_008737 [Pythium oligandrum]
MKAQDETRPLVSVASKEDVWRANATLVELQQACAVHKTCDECLAASYACHFCEFDFQCHAIGSPLGCITGISQCHHLEDCERQEPQHVGYGPPPSVVIAVLCLVVTLTCCLCGLSAICSVFLRSARRRRQKPRNATPTAATEPASPDQSEPLLSTIDEDESILTFEEDVDGVAIERLNRLHEERSSSRVSWKTVCFRLTWLGALVVVTVLALMFYPRMPDYNVCNRQFEWESILQSLRHLSPKIEYDVLISVINENRFGFVLEKGRADIYHNETWVGRWELNQTWEAKAGAISDVIAPIRLDPGYAEGIALWNAFRKNELIFRINASITGSITWGHHKIYRISSAVPDIEFLVGAEYDRGLCKCTEYLEPQ